MDWSIVEVGMLIKQVKERECLWKMDSRNYSNRLVRQKAWGEVGEEMKKMRTKLNAAACKKKWTILRTGFLAEYKKVLASKKSGLPSDEIYTPSVHYYNKMDFVRGQVKQRKRSSNSGSSGDLEREFIFPHSMLMVSVGAEDDSIDYPQPSTPSSSHSVNVSSPPTQSTGTLSSSQTPPASSKPPITSSLTVPQFRQQPKTESSPVESSGALVEARLAQERFNDDIEAFCRFLEVRMRHLPEHRLSYVFMQLTKVVSEALETADAEDSV